MKFLRRLLLTFVVFGLAISFSVHAENQRDIVVYSDVDWSPLNPARGDKSPQAGQLWGDRKLNEASGFLVKFADGFSSPPHIHNVTYRGVVISGLVHNDDPKAENMWLPAGSFWTQPAGESHITAARGEKNIAYIEIDEGPYLVKPAQEAFDNGERPVNVDQSNLVWLNASDITWIDQADGVQVSFLWGQADQGKSGGRFIKLPKGFSGDIEIPDPLARAVIVQGHLTLGSLKLEPGSYFGFSQRLKHDVYSENGVVIYVRSREKFQVGLK